MEHPGRRHHAVLGRSLGGVEPGSDEECSQAVFFWHADLNLTKLNKNLFNIILFLVGKSVGGDYLKIVIQFNCRKST